MPVSLASHLRCLRLSILLQGPGHITTSFRICPVLIPVWVCPQTEHILEADLWTEHIREADLWTEHIREADLWTEHILEADLWTEHIREADLWTESALEGTLVKYSSNSIFPSLFSSAQVPLDWLQHRGHQGYQGYQG